MASNTNVEVLLGTWDHVRSENLEDFLKEVGVPLPIRMMAKRLNPRLFISQENGVWTIRTESTFKTMTSTFTPGEEFEDTMPSGEKVKTMVTFEDGKWMQTAIDKNGKKTVVIRSVEDQGLQKVDMSVGNVKAVRWFKRAT